MMPNAIVRGFPGSRVIKNLPVNAGNVGSIPGLGRSFGGNANPLQYSCQDNSMERGAWRAIVHGVTELDKTEQLSMHAQYYVYSL